MGRGGGDCRCDQALEADFTPLAGRCRSSKRYQVSGFREEAVSHFWRPQATSNRSRDAGGGKGTLLIYADTSFLASLYLQDANSATASTWFAANPQPILLSRLAELELFNACRLSVFRRWVSAKKCQEVLAAIESDLQAGVLMRQPFSAEEIFQLSERLSARHTWITGSRTLDILHVAHAVENKLGTFATFDQRQAVLAIECGLEVVPQSPTTD